MGLKPTERKLVRVRLPPSAQLEYTTMKRHIDKDFFKTWTEEMSYILGYIVADGCIYKRKDRKNSYVLNITSKDRDHLRRINESLHSDYPISIKYNSQRMPYSQIQISNLEICKDLMNLGILPRKTIHLEPINVRSKYFPDFVRGFFDGDGSVYIYKVNYVSQIKASFVCASYSFLSHFNTNLCEGLDILPKSIHQELPKKSRSLVKYRIDFYISDCEKLAKYLYKNDPTLYLSRKRRIFESWESKPRRHYVKKNYPSKIGWHLNKQISILH